MNHSQKNRLAPLPPAALIGLAALVSMGATAEASVETALGSSTRSSVTSALTHRQTAARLLAKLSDAAKTFRGMHGHVPSAALLTRPTWTAVLIAGHFKPDTTSDIPQPQPPLRDHLTDLPPPISG